MQLPREVVVGHGSLDLIGDLCKRLNLMESALVVTGPHTIHISGRRVIDLLEDQGLEVNYFTLPSQNPTLRDVALVDEKIEELKPQVVIGNGGGAKIDIAKLSSARGGVPFISIPTTASHDGMASPFASIKGFNRPYSVMAQSPIAVIADTSIIIQAPHYFLASGCGDIIAKFTSTLDWKLAHQKTNEYYAQYTASLALMSAQHITENAEIIKEGAEEGLRVLLEALVSCGVAMGIAETSRPCSGSEHLFSHALDLIAPKPAMHGEQCGLGTIMMAYLHGMDWKDIKNTLKKVEAPTKAAQIGIESEYVIEALVQASKIRPDRYTILNEKKLTYESAKRLAEITGVID